MVAPYFFLETTVIAGWPMWMFRGEQQRLFQEGDEIPDGWYDRPSKFNGADPAAFDHDGIGGPGGSIPKRRGRPPKAKVFQDAGPRGMEDKAPSNSPSLTLAQGTCDGA